MSELPAVDSSASSASATGSQPGQDGHANTTHFGFETVDKSEKSSRVGQVFTSVASSYDVMNDAMSVGLHRGWKWFTLQVSGARAGEKVLDVASGSGDLALAFAKRVGQSGEVWMTDINAAMLQRGVDRVLNEGYLLPSSICDAEHLPFADATFDIVSVGFGLRNMTDKDQALREMSRVLKPGGRLLVLEFSHISKPLQKPYHWYLSNVLPRLGRWIAKDEGSYRYLAESIQMHPDQQTLSSMMQNAGLVNVEYFNLTAGICALHRGLKA